MAFTFKKHPQMTGLASIGQRTLETDIKHKGKCVGLIIVPRLFEDNVRVRLMVKQEAHPGWGWVTLKAGFDTEGDARAKLNERYEYVLKTFDLHHQDD